MSRQRYTDEFMTEAVKQVTERGLLVTEVAARVGVSAHMLYQWMKRYAKPPSALALHDHRPLR